MAEPRWSFPTSSRHASSSRLENPRPVNGSTFGAPTGSASSAVVADAYTASQGNPTSDSTFSVAPSENDSRVQLTGWHLHVTMV
ncbi:hypothetical protein FKP32DRAFT_1594342 [Trametes sanguinea]|nr:hypothetical protein FKP32DRAFT_1594342 [Trametes sanguinea]